MPSQDNDIVVINQTKGTPQNYNKAHNHNIEMTYTDGDLTRIDEIMDGVLRKRTTLTYQFGNLATVNEKIYALDGTTVSQEYTDTLTYDIDDNLENVVRSVI